MAGMTRKEYKQKKAKIEKRLAEVQAILAEALLTDGASLVHIDDWNDYHDEEDDLVAELNQLEQEWDRRNWTAAHYNTASLIAQNID